MLTLTPSISIPESELSFTAIRAQGAGGQNVNKVSTAIHLRFDIRACSLPQHVKDQLLQLKDQRISKEGVIVIKAQTFRTQEKNRDDALARLKRLIQTAMVVKKPRRPTKPSKRSQQKRLDSKSLRSKTKALRRKISE